MILTPQDAAQALKDVEQVSDRSTTLRGYRAASPGLILWGLVWIVVNVSCDRWPRQVGLLWTLGDVIGFAGSAFLVFRTASPRTLNRRGLAIMGVIVATAVAAELLLQIRSAEILTALICLVVGGGYMVWGVWRGARLFAVGLTIAIVSLTVGLVHPPHFFLWLAAIGGGALILGGLWLPRT